MAGTSSGGGGKLPYVGGLPMPVNPITERLLRQSRTITSGVSLPTTRVPRKVTQSVISKLNRLGRQTDARTIGKPVKTANAVPIRVRQTGASQIPTGGRPTGNIGGPSSTAAGASPKTPGLPVGRNQSGSSPVDSLLKQAQEQISAQMDPQLADLQNQINNATSNVNAQQGDLAELYRRLQVQLGARQAAGDQSNSNALSAISGNYDKLDQALQNIYGGAATGTGNELQRLGIQDVAPQAMAGQKSDQQFLGGLAQTDRANSMSNATGKQQSFDNLMGVLQSQGALSGADKTAVTLRLAQQTIQDLQGKKGALAATRAAAVDTLYRQLLSANSQKQADLAQQQFMDKIAAAKLGISQQALGIKAGELGVKQGQLGVAQGKLGLAAQNAVTQRDLNRARAYQALQSGNKTAGGGSGSVNQKGYTSGLNFLNSKLGTADAAASPALRSAISLYRYYITNYGKNAFQQMTNTGPQPVHNNKADRYYRALPADIKGFLMDAMRIANA